MRAYYDDINRAIEQLRDQDNVARPDGDQLRRMAEPHGVRTQFGNVNYSTAVRNRSKELTVILGGPEVMQTDLNPSQQRIVRELPETLKKVHRYIQQAPLVCVARTMGQNPYFSPHCTLYVSTHRKDCIRIPYVVSNALRRPPRYRARDEPGLYPRVAGEGPAGAGVPGDRSSLRAGHRLLRRVQEGFLRMAMVCQRAWMLGLHAGSKLITARTASGQLAPWDAAAGPDRNRHTTHAAHNHNLHREGEEVKLVQDDVVFWRDDGSALGSEAGLFIKTDSLEDGSQPILYEAAKEPEYDLRERDGGLSRADVHERRGAHRQRPCGGAPGGPRRAGVGEH